MEVLSVGSGNLLAYHIGDHTGIVHPHVHTGMMHDSVLYIKGESEYGPCSFDFRYFPGGWGDSMETYCWSDNIKYAVIKHEIGKELDFNNNKIPPGETGVFDRSDHRDGMFY